MSLFKFRQTPHTYEHCFLFRNDFFFSKFIFGCKSMKIHLDKFHVNFLNLIWQNFPSTIYIFIERNYIGSNLVVEANLTKGLKIRNIYAFIPFLSKKAILKKNKRINIIQCLCRRCMEKVYLVRHEIGEGLGEIVLLLFISFTR